MAYRYFYDCEFIEDGRTIDLVSIGVVDEHGREFYAVSTEFDGTRAVPWVRRNVLDKLPSPADPAWRSRERIRDDLLRVPGRAAARPPGEQIELWAWYAAYDHVALAQLWGAMPALPREIPRFTKELRQLWDDRAGRRCPTPRGQRHDALVDARHNLARWRADCQRDGTARRSVIAMPVARRLRVAIRAAARSASGRQRRRRCRRRRGPADPTVT